jgi:hypothetical protein
MPYPMNLSRLPQPLISIMRKDVNREGKKERKGKGKREKGKGKREKGKGKREKGKEKREKGKGERGKGKGKINKQLKFRDIIQMEYRGDLKRRCVVMTAEESNI